MDAQILAIVVPCYKEEEVLAETTRRLTDLLDRLVAANSVSNKSFILYVNDGSTDLTWPIICQLHESNKYVRGLNLAANVGHQCALLAGLNTAYPLADLIVSIDADLQDDIEAITEMVRMYREEGCDIVYGVRRERKTDTWFKRNTALAFYKLMNGLGVKSVYNHADYRLMSRRAVEFLCQFPERNLFLRGMVPLIGYKTGSVYYDRAERFAGESKYPLSKMLNFAIDGITSFSVKPIFYIFTLGCIFVLISLIIGAYVIYSIISGSAVSGWASLILSIWFVGGMLMISLGMVGVYIGKIYKETKRRPLYHIDETIL